MAFRTLLWKRPFLPSALLPSPSSSKCVFTPICLSGSFHESLRFPLDGRARLSMLTTHNRPTFSRPPPPVLQRVPRRSYTRRTNPARGRNRQFKDRLIFLLVACFFSFFFWSRFHFRFFTIFGPWLSETIIYSDQLSIEG